MGIWGPVMFHVCSSLYCFVLFLGLFCCCCWPLFFFSLVLAPKKENNAFWKIWSPYQGTDANAGVQYLRCQCPCKAASTFLPAKSTDYTAVDLMALSWDLSPMGTLWNSPFRFPASDRSSFFMGLRHRSTEAGMKANQSGRYCTATFRTTSLLSLTLRVLGTLASCRLTYFPGYFLTTHASRLLRAWTTSP